jgi:hypothetical protein
MSTYVKGLTSKNNEEYKKHAKVLTACLEAGIEKLPEETAKFFNNEYVEEYLFEEKLEMDLNIKEYSDVDKSRQRFILKVKDIPKEVEEIVFYNSW